MTVTIKGADDLYQDFSKFVRVNGRAISDAMNRANLAGATASLSKKEGMRKEWVGINASELKKYTYKRKANPNKLEAQFVVTSNPIPLIHFKAKEVRRGVSYRLKNKRRTMPKSWIMPSKFGDKGDRVFVRTRKRPKVATHRVAITPTSMYTGAEADDVYVNRFLEIFAKRYYQQLDRLMKA